MSDEILSESEVAESYRVYCNDGPVKRILASHELLRAKLTKTEADRAEWKEAWWRQRDATGRMAWELMPEVVELRAKLAEAEASAAICREALERPCPVTDFDFFMTINHPDLGWVPTYGGPYDSFGPVERDEETGELSRWRYCHDRGEWVEQEALCERIVSENDEDAERDVLRARVAELEAKLAEAEHDVRILERVTECVAGERAAILNMLRWEFGPLRWLCLDRGDAELERIDEVLASVEAGAHLQPPHALAALDPADTPCAVARPEKCRGCDRPAIGPHRFSCYAQGSRISLPATVTSDGAMRVDLPSGEKTIRCYARNPYHDGQCRHELDHSGPHEADDHGFAPKATSGKEPGDGE